MSQPAFANNGNADILQTVLKPYYALYNQANACQGTWANDGSYDGITKEAYQIGYCVQVDSQKIVQTSQGKRMYVIVTGDVAFDAAGDEITGGHVHSGLVGMFVLKPHPTQANTWQVESADPYMNAGSFGHGLTEWRLLQFSPESWGFLNEHGDTHFGVSGTDYVILTPNGKGIMQSWIGSSYNNAATGNCGEAKQPTCDDIQSTFAINRTSVVNRFYPLNIVVTGEMNQQSYAKQSYKLYYLPNKGYITPQNYPLNDLDF